MKERSNWQNYVIGALGTLLLFVSSLYVTSANASVAKLETTQHQIQSQQTQHGERIATLEEAVKQIGELKQSLRELTDAINESNRRNPR